MTTSEAGTASSETTASSGLIVSIMIRTPTIVSSDVISWVRLCWSDCADVVDVVRDPAQQVAARMAVEVAQRQPAELRVDVAAQSVDRPLGDAGHDVALQPAEDRAHDVQADQQDDTPPSGPKSMPTPGVRCIAREHVRELVLARARSAATTCSCVSAGRQLLADRALEDRVDRVAQDLRADDGERRR